MSEGGIVLRKGLHYSHSLRRHKALFVEVVGFGFCAVYLEAQVMHNIYNPFTAIS